MYVLPARMPRKRAPGAKRNAHPEDDLHLAVAKLLNAILQKNVWWSTIGHGTSRLPLLLAVRLKRKGLKQGISDIWLIWRDASCQLAMGCLELKSEKGVLSDGQKVFRAEMMLLGVSYGIARSLDDVRGLLAQWGVPARESKYTNVSRS